MGAMSADNGFTTPLLRVFVEVARLGSFTAAGPVLGYTQSAISRQISALEHEAGTALFDRLPRGVRLTEPGRRLLGHAEVVLARLDQARRELADLRELATGRVRIGAFATALAALVPRAVVTFRRCHPEVSVSLREGFTPTLIDLVVAGDIDLAVVSDVEAQRPDGGAGVTLHKLCDDYMYVAIPREHRFAGARKLRLTQLADEVWIAGHPTPEDTLIRSCLRSGFEPHIGFVARDWMAKLGLVAAGVGVTLLPSLALGAARSDVALAPLHPDDIPPRPVHAAMASGLTPSPAALAFLSVLYDRGSGDDE